MAIQFSTREGETMGIAFPITQNNEPFPAGAITQVQMVLSGFNGQLGGVVISDPSRLFFIDPVNGVVIYYPGLGELHHNYSPYKLYFRLFTDSLHYFTVPAPPMYYLLTVEDNDI